MKTFYVQSGAGGAARVASFLIAYNYPFQFDGKVLEVTLDVNGTLLKKLYNMDRLAYNLLCA